MANAKQRDALDRLHQISQKVSLFNPELSAQIDQEIERLEKGTEIDIVEMFFTVLKLTLEFQEINDVVNVILKGAFEYFNSP